MQITYRFRIYFEEHEDIVRVIDILANQTFEQFHHIIQDAIAFDKSKDVEFWLASDNWRKEKMVAKYIPNEDEETTYKKLKAMTLNQFIYDPHQRFIYIFDSSKEWTLYCELTKIQKADPTKTYPFVFKKENDPPKQYQFKPQINIQNEISPLDQLATTLLASKKLDHIDDSMFSEDDIDLEGLDLDIESIAIDVDLSIPEPKPDKLDLPGDILLKKERFLFDLKLGDDAEIKPKSKTIDEDDDFFDEDDDLDNLDEEEDLNYGENYSDYDE